MPIVKKPVTPKQERDQFVSIMIWGFIVVSISLSVIWIIVPLIKK